MSAIAGSEFLQAGVLVALVVACALPLSGYLVDVMEGRPLLIRRALGLLERSACRLVGAREDDAFTAAQRALVLPPAMAAALPGELAAQYGMTGAELDGAMAAVSPLLFPAVAADAAPGQLERPALWAQGISGDLPVWCAQAERGVVRQWALLRALGVGAKLKVKDTATMMIICSDNIATNMIIDYLGLDTINACIRELGFGHTVLHNPLHFDRYDKLGTTTPRDYAALFAQVAKGTLVSKEASAAMLGIFRQQHYNTMLTHDFPQFYLDCEETGEPELIWVASKSGSMNACRNDGGIIHTPYGEYVIVLMNKEFHDIIEYNDHPAMVYGARVSRMILDQILACEGKLYL